MAFVTMRREEEESARSLSAEEMAEYRRPFAELGEGRRWPRQIPIEGDPAE